ncbi:MAG: hypothetical protein IKF07_07060 [Eubacterium sp.]|nr:hypothetical protein [Eubacterium sp.]
MESQMGGLYQACFSKAFNAKERADLVDPNDNSPKGLSIRVFMGIVKTTEYQQTLGINVFTATV